MINYSITARAVNPNLFEINQAKTRINQAKAEGKQPDPKDEALVGTVVTNYFATAQYTEVMGIEKFARHIAAHGTTYSRADIMAILYMCINVFLLLGSGRLGSRLLGTLTSLLCHISIVWICLYILRKLMLLIGYNTISETDSFTKITMQHFT